MANNTKVRDLIFTAIEVSKRSKVPILFLSNPGWGKTTSINLYAKLNGYHVETLIGSRFSPEEIMGYQVNNGGESLKCLQPEWYNRIMEKKNENIPTILFLDEISTCSDSVQGALLSLIFDRKIGNGKYLPEDCIIISAANYKKNLSAFFNILSPTQNRFCIINLIDPAQISPIELIHEFNQSPRRRSEIDKNVLTFDNINIDEDFEDKIYEKMEEFYIKLIQNYSDKRSSKGCIDIYNNNIEDIYESEGMIYGFISGRSMNYTTTILKALISMGVDNKNIYLNSFLFGLIGLGSNTFNSTQLDAYQKEISSGFKDVLKELSITKNSKNESKSEKSIKIDDDSSISSVIQEYENYYESTSFEIDKNIVDVYNFIVKKSKEINSNFEYFVEDASNAEVYAKFVSDVEAIKRFRTIINSLIVDESNEYYERILKVKQNFTKIIDAFESIINTIDKSNSN